MEGCGVQWRFISIGGLKKGYLVKIWIFKIGNMYWKEGLAKRFGRYLSIFKI